MTKEKYVEAIKDGYTPIFNSFTSFVNFLYKFLYYVRMHDKLIKTIQEKNIEIKRLENKLK